MKYGESIFDILYLLTAIISGIVLLFKNRGTAGKPAGAAVLLLGAGDAFHLVPRVLNYFIDADFTFWLGLGKLVTSITMTVFYVLMYIVGSKLFGIDKKTASYPAVAALAVMRIAICLFPQNGWFTNDGEIIWSIARNVPFAALGAAVIMLFFLYRGVIGELKRVWLYVTLSFAFYLPVAILAGIFPLLGMLMLPKTVCYVLIIIAFLRFSFHGGKADKSKI